MFRFFLFVELPWFWLRCYGWVSNRDALTMKRSKCSLIIIIIRIIIIIINNLDNHCTSGGCWRCCDSFSRKSCNVAEDLSLALINKCMYECTYTYLYVIHIMYIYIYIILIILYHHHHNDGLYLRKDLFCPDFISQ